MDPSTRDRLLGEIKKTGLRPPRVVTLMITNGCNLKCRHCWPESLSHEAVLPVPVQPLKGLIMGFNRLGVEEICLTGGEPLTHPDWLEVFRFSCGQEGLRRVRLQTNGTLLTQKDVEHLAEIHKKELIIQVSLEGATPKTHDRLRGKGSFERAFRGLNRLAAAGMGGQTVVAFTETHYNFDDLPHLLKRLDGLGIGRLVSGTLVQAGRAARIHALELPTPDQYRALLSLYHREEAFRKRYHKMANIACLEWWFGKTNSASENCKCFEMPYVTTDGLLYPCIMIPADHLAVKNAHEQPLETLLKKAIPLWSGLPALNRRRTVELGLCQTCSCKQHCAGGCMGRAYATTGDFMMVEDRCALRKAVYGWDPI